MVRIKNRYLLVNFLYPNAPKSAATKASNEEPLPDVVHFHGPSSDDLTPQYLVRLIRDGVLELYGEYGAGAIGPGLKVNYLSSATSTAIIRAPRNHYRLVWGALSFVTKLPAPIGRECVIRVVRVSGTIRKAEDEVIRRAKDAIVRAQAAMGHSKNGSMDFLGQSMEKSTTRAKDAESIEDKDMDDVDGDSDEEDAGEKIER